MDRGSASDVSRRKMEGNASEGGYTMETADSTPASSAMSERNIEPVGKHDIQVEMAMMMMQRMQREGQDCHFPSAASLGSSIWSSSAGNSMSGSEDSDSYAWSTSLNSESDDGSDFSSYSGSDEESESSGEEDEAQDKVPPIPKKSYPQPPPGMMEGLPLGLGGLPLSLESLKKDLEKVGRAILSSNAGEIAAERAQTLASINWLASHVPNAVLDQLGHETRQLIADEKDGVDVSDNSQDSRVASVVESDAMSDVSDLSHDHANEQEFELGPKSDVADAANVAQSYGDLATYTHPTGSTIRERPPSTIHSVSSNPDNTNPHSDDKKKGIMDILPRADGDSGLSGKQVGSPGMLSPGESSGLTPGSKKSKGVKGLFTRFVKRRNLPKGQSPLPEGAPPFDDSNPQLDLDDNESGALMLPDDDDASQSLGGSSHAKGSSTHSASASLDKEDRPPKILGKRLPYSSDYRCALLFVDISGFTKLSTKLDPESLSKVKTGGAVCRGHCGTALTDFVSGNQRILSTHCERSS